MALPHVSPWTVVLFLLQGRITALVGDTSYDVEPGALVVIPAGTPSTSGEARLVDHGPQAAAACRQGQRSLRWVGVRRRRMREQGFEIVGPWEARGAKSWRPERLGRREVRSLYAIGAARRGAPGRIRTCATSLGGRSSASAPAFLSTLQSPIRRLQPPGLLWSTTVRPTNRTTKYDRLSVTRGDAGARKVPPAVGDDEGGRGRRVRRVDRRA